MMVVILVEVLVGVWRGSGVQGPRFGVQGPLLEGVREGVPKTGFLANVLLIKGFLRDLIPKRLGF